MKYRMIVLDIDGTLTNDKKEITPKTLDALIKAQEQGTIVVLASGRPAQGIKLYAEQLRLADYGGYVLALNGGMIIDWKTREVVMEKTLDNDLIPVLYNYAKREGFAILSYLDDAVATETPEDEYVQIEARINRMPLVKVDNFLTDLKMPLNKCLIVGDPDPLHVLEMEMHEALKERMEVYRSAAFFMELVPKGIDKAQTLNVLLERVGMKREEVIACGDGYNDISMIEFAGLGVAMQNAIDEVKAAANHVTLDNEHDGIAAVVEEFIL